MTIKTALGGTALAAACLLVGGNALAQGRPSIGSTETPGTQSDARTLGQPNAPSDAPGLGQPREAPSAMPTTPSDTPRSAVDSGAVSVAGRVEKVDRADDTIEIEGVDRQLKVDPSTTVIRNGAHASFSDIEEGEQVRASFDDGFPAHARQVEIVGGGTATSESQGEPSATQGEPAAGEPAARPQLR